VERGCQQSRPTAGHRAIPAHRVAEAAPAPEVEEFRKTLDRQMAEGPNRAEKVIALREQHRNNLDALMASAFTTGRA
jgi:hypothetical protein